MKLQSIHNNLYQRNLSFQSWHREVYNHAKNEYIVDLHHRNDTEFFRDSEFWAQFSYFLVNTYKDTPKVNVYSYGCSDGSEPYTFVMRMLSMYPEAEAKKFLPIIAKDYDKAAIKKAVEREEYFIQSYEKADIEYYTKGCYKRFFHTNKPYGSCEYASVKDELFNNVKFNVANIEKDYTNIVPQNSVVIARNFWPYIESWSQRQKVLNNLGSRLREKSFLVIGIYDQKGTCWKIDNQILDAGFKRTNLPLVFEKMSDKELIEKGMHPLRHFF